jgi:hypothetical protein
MSFPRITLPIEVIPSARQRQQQDGYTNRDDSQNQKPSMPGVIIHGSSG